MVSSSSSPEFSEKDIQKALALMACHTGSLNFQMEPIFKARDNDEADTRRLDLLYLSSDGKLVVGIEVKKNRISGEDMYKICVEKAYPEVIKNKYPERHIMLIVTNPLACGISSDAIYLMEHFKYEGVSINYLPVESIGESLFQEFVDNRPEESAWIDKRVRKEHSLCLSKLS